MKKRTTMLLIILFFSNFLLQGGIIEEKYQAIVKDFFPIIFSLLPDTELEFKSNQGKTIFAIGKNFNYICITLYNKVNKKDSFLFDKEGNISEIKISDGKITLQQARELRIIMPYYRWGIKCLKTIFIYKLWFFPGY